MELTQELKDMLKEQRLEQYRAQIYSLKMDFVAYEAIDDQEKTKATRKAIEDGEKAYAAVEAME